MTVSSIMKTPPAAPPAIAPIGGACPIAQKGNDTKTNHINNCYKTLELLSPVSVDVGVLVPK